MASKQHLHDQPRAKALAPTLPASTATTSGDSLEANFGKPHVVILGAGASLAAFPKGDRNSRRLPAIRDFVETLDMEPLLSSRGISGPYDDFEGLYSDITLDPAQQDLRHEIEQRVAQPANIRPASERNERRRPRRKPAAG